MTAKGILRDAKDALGNAIKAFQAGDSVQAALKWLEAVWEEKPTEDEKEEIHLKVSSKPADHPSRPMRYLMS